MMREKTILLILVVLNLAVFLIGAAILNQHRSIEPVDLVEAYEKGKKDALKTNPVSLELEMTCAGLWAGQLQVKH